MGLISPPASVVHPDTQLASVLRASAQGILNQVAAPVSAALQLAIFAHHLPMGDTASYVAVGATVQ